MQSSLSRPCVHRHAGCARLVDSSHKVELKNVLSKALRLTSRASRLLAVEPLLNTVFIALTARFRTNRAVNHNSQQRLFSRRAAITAVACAQQIGTRFNRRSTVDGSARGDVGAGNERQRRAGSGAGVEVRGRAVEHGGGGQQTC